MRCCIYWTQTKGTTKTIDMITTGNDESFRIKDLTIKASAESWDIIKMSIFVFYKTTNCEQLYDDMMVSKKWQIVWRFKQLYKWPMRIFSLSSVKATLFYIWGDLTKFSVVYSEKIKVILCNRKVLWSLKKPHNLGFSFRNICWYQQSPILLLKSNHFSEALDSNALQRHHKTVNIFLVRNTTQK